MRLIITIIKQLDRKVEITYSRSPGIHQVSRTDTHTHTQGPLSSLFSHNTVHPLHTKGR